MESVIKIDSCEEKQSSLESGRNLHSSTQNLKQQQQGDSKKTNDTQDKSQLTIQEFQQIFTPLKKNKKRENSITERYVQQSNINSNDYSFTSKVQQYTESGSQSYNNNQQKYKQTDQLKVPNDKQLAFANVNNQSYTVGELSTKSTNNNFEDSLDQMIKSSPKVKSHHNLLNNNCQKQRNSLRFTSILEQCMKSDIQNLQENMHNLKRKKNSLIGNLQQQHQPQVVDQSLIPNKVESKCLEQIKYQQQHQSNTIKQKELKADQGITNKTFQMIDVEKQRSFLEEFKQNQAKCFDEIRAFQIKYNLNLINQPEREVEQEKDDIIKNNNYKENDENCNQKNQAQQQQQNQKQKEEEQENNSTQNSFLSNKQIINQKYQNQETKDNEFFDDLKQNNQLQDQQQLQWTDKQNQPTFTFGSSEKWIDQNINSKVTCINDDINNISIEENLMENQQQKQSQNKQIQNQQSNQSQNPISEENTSQQSQEDISKSNLSDKKNSFYELNNQSYHQKSESNDKQSIMMRPQINKNHLKPSLPKIPTFLNKGMSYNEVYQKAKLSFIKQQIGNSANLNEQILTNLKVENQKQIYQQMKMNPNYQGNQGQLVNFEQRQQQQNKQFQQGKSQLNNQPNNFSSFNRQIQSHSAEKIPRITLFQYEAKSNLLKSQKSHQTIMKHPKVLMNLVTKIDANNSNEKNDKLDFEYDNKHISSFSKDQKKWLYMQSIKNPETMINGQDLVQQHDLLSKRTVRSFSTGQGILPPIEKNVDLLTDLLEKKMQNQMEQYSASKVNLNISYSKEAIKQQEKQLMISRFLMEQLKKQKQTNDIQKRNIEQQDKKIEEKIQILQNTNNQVFSKPLSYNQRQISKSLQNSLSKEKIKLEKNSTALLTAHKLRIHQQQQEQNFYQNYQSKTQRDTISNQRLASNQKYNQSAPFSQFEKEAIIYIQDDEDNNIGQQTNQDFINNGCISNNLNSNYKSQTQNNYKNNNKINQQRNLTYQKSLCKTSVGKVIEKNIVYSNIGGLKNYDKGNQLQQNNLSKNQQRNKENKADKIECQPWQTNDDNFMTNSEDQGISQFINQLKQQ